MSYQNLNNMLDRADAIDICEGKLAYDRYNDMMHDIALMYSFPVERVIAAFAALSPNNDYYGNLRSLVSVLDGINRDCPCDSITISTYGHCRDRAYQYALGRVSFPDTVRGLKIRAFYFNILDPLDRKHATIDGHMVAAYHGNAGTMKDNIVRPREYVEIERELKRLASHVGLIPNQLQAIIWFTRKRTLSIKYDAQLKLFNGVDNAWGTLLDVSTIKPYNGFGS